jgi:hypothetical protein
MVNQPAEGDRPAGPFSYFNLFHVAKTGKKAARNQAQAPSAASCGLKNLSESGEIP